MKKTLLFLFSVVSVLYAQSYDSVTISSDVGSNKIEASILVQPDKDSVVSGQVASFTIQVYGTGLSYQWYRNNIPVGTNNFYYTFVATTVNDYDSIWCIAQADTGSSIKSSVVKMRCTANPSPTVIASQPQNQTANIDSLDTFSITATNVIKYQWYRNGTLIQGAQANIYFFKAAVEFEGAKIWCVVNDTLVSDTAVLTVNLPAPTITTQPQDATVNKGETVYFSITATNALIYQWWRNDSLITGAVNSTFAFTADSALDGSNIFCVVNNSLHSDTVTLTIDPTQLVGVTRVWNSTGSTDMNLSSNYTGTGQISRLDTLVFNNTSVVNAIATANLLCGMIVINSNYSGTFNFTNRELTLNNGGLSVDGTLTFTFGNKITSNGNNTIHIGSTVNTSNSSACAVVLNGSVVTDFDKAFSIRSLNIYGNTQFAGAQNIALYRTSNDIPLTLGNNSLLYGTGLITINTTTTCQFASLGTGAEIRLGLTVQSQNTSGNIIITVPKINIIGSTISFLTRYAGTCTFQCNDSIIAGKLVINNYSGGAALTFNSDYYIAADSLVFGSSNAGSKQYINLGYQDVICESFLGSYSTDSTYINCDNTKLNVARNYSLGTNKKITGNINQNPTDLFIGHTMLTPLTAMSTPFCYEVKYGKRYFTNRSVTGSTISQINARIDSCITAYSPKRVILWAGTYDLNYDDAGQFATAEATYWTQWRQIINKIKAANIDSVFVLDLPPRGTVASPMSAQKVINFTGFNSRLKDSCITNELFYVSTYDSLLKGGYAGVINDSYSSDGITPNLVDGIKKSSFLIANTSTSLKSEITEQPRDTFTDENSSCTFKVVATNVLNIKWYRNDSLVAGANGSTFSFVAPYHLNGASIYCVVNDTLHSDTVHLTVNHVFTITEQPRDTTVTAGQSATFRITVTPTPIKYQWYGNNTLIAGATSSTYTFTTNYGLNGSTIFCVVNDTLHSDTVTLTVNQVITINESADTIKLVCSSNGSTFQWYKNKVAIEGETDSVLTIIADGAFYAEKPTIYCLVNGTTHSGNWVFNQTTSNLGKWATYRRAYRLQAFKDVWK